MRSYFKITLLYLLFCINFLSAIADEGYQIKVKINGVRDTVCYMARYYGPKQYYHDTSKVDGSGRMIFEGKDKLEGGIYSIITPGNKYFEFIVNEQIFSLETDTLNFIEYMKVKGSEENEIFFKWLNFINVQHNRANPLRELLKTIKNNEDSTKLIKEQLSNIDNEVKEYQKTVINEHPQSFVAKIFSSSFETEVPEAPILADGKKDSLFEFRFLKAHYFDNIDFSDDRLVRTPILHNKVERYIKNLTVQIPDTLIIACDYVIEKSRASKEVFKYVVSYLLNEFANSKYMGMDAVYVHIAEKYYTEKDAYWTDSTTLYKISERAIALKPTLIGKIAPELVLQDITGQYKSLHAIKAKYTILYFWDPDCGHCKKVTPKLKEFYEKNRHKDIEVYAVCSAIEKDKWEAYIKSNELKWINVGDFDLHNYFRTFYDISSTPKVFLLDENKKIIAKQLEVEQIEEYIDFLFKEKKL